MEEKEYLQTLGEQILNPHARTHVPVSYTHLDVYKRQVMDRSTGVP